ncbi:MAG: SDR family oxidoreductase [Pedobacter sp.]|nr:MAG: SDR family oxidoreductase [Pedobacter sp.]
MKTVLVTGSNGLLGQKITEKVLKDGGFNLIASSRGKNRFPVHEGYTYVEMDISVVEEIRSVIAKFKPDAIIHTAALTNVDQAEEEKELAFSLNVEAVKTLVEVCESLNIQLVHLSTDFIFDGQHGPYAEDAIPNPVSYYGETKLLGEQEVVKSKGNWAILRTILVYGIVADMSRSNIVLWAKNALEKGEPLNVVEDQWRMPTLAEDLAEGCLLAVRHDAQGIFHLSGKDMMSVADLVERVADFWSLDKSLINKVTSSTLNQKARRPVKTGFILDKSMTELQYHPHSFEEGLALVRSQLEKKIS